MSNRLPYDVASALLDKLATDDAFRARFQADARAALKELGYETPAGDHGQRGRDPVLDMEHPRGGLASKEKVAATRDQFLSTARTAEDGTVTVASQPFDFCAESGG